MILLLATSYKRTEARVAPSAKGASLLRLMLNRDVPFHPRVAQSGRPPLSRLERILQTLQEIHCGLA